MDLYQYEDYRQYLKDRFEKESLAPSFSWRKFSHESGISNPGDVIKGRRKLSRSGATICGCRALRTTMSCGTSWSFRRRTGIGI